MDRRAFLASTLLFAAYPRPASAQTIAAAPARIGLTIPNSIIVGADEVIE